MAHEQCDTCGQLMAKFQQGFSYISYLANAGVACQAIGILMDGQRGGSGSTDLEHGAPLCEARALRIVLGAALAQVVKALRRRELAAISRLKLVLASLNS